MVTKGYVMFNMSATERRSLSVDESVNGKAKIVGQELKKEWTISIPESVLFQQIGDEEGEVVLLDLQNGGYFGLNEVGASIWCLIQENKTIGAILGALEQEYEVSEERLRSDLAEFLTELRSRGLVEIHETSAG
jgi:hypothetical protein